MNDAEKAYADYLDDVFHDGYGEELFEVDPIAFEVGMNEWLRLKGEY